LPSQTGHLIKRCERVISGDNDALGMSLSFIKQLPSCIENLELVHWVYYYLKKFKKLQWKKNLVNQKKYKNKINLVLL
jgi:hypothetical protein